MEKKEQGSKTKRMQVVHQEGESLALGKWGLLVYVGGSLIILGQNTKKNMYSQRRFCGKLYAALDSSFKS